VAVTTQHLGALSPPVQDEAEFEAIFLRHYPRVYVVLFRLLGNRAEAEDLALEAFWKLWKQPPARGDNLAGWLYRVAMRLGFNALRGAKRRQRYEEAAGLDALEHSVMPDPLHEVQRGDERARVRAVLARLAERDAQLLIFRYSGLSYKEIAAALSVSPASIGKLLTRAEAAFEKQYLMENGTAPEGGFDAPQ